MKGRLIAGLRIIGGIVVGTVLGYVLARVVATVIVAIWLMNGATVSESVLGQVPTAWSIVGTGGVGWFMVFIPLGALLGGIRGVIVTARVWRQTARQ